MLQEMTDDDIKEAKEEVMAFVKEVLASDDWVYFHNIIRNLKCLLRNKKSSKQ